METALVAFSVVEQLQKGGPCPIAETHHHLYLHHVTHEDESLQLGPCNLTFLPSNVPL